MTQFDQTVRAVDECVERINRSISECSENFDKMKKCMGMLTQGIVEHMFGEEGMMDGVDNVGSDVATGAGIHIQVTQA
jgi:hypothetical protein